MLDYYFTFRSMTAAQQAAMELNESGYFAALLRAPKALAGKGCGYAVRISLQNGSAAASILRNAGIFFEKVFRMDVSGLWREAFL